MILWLNLSLWFVVFHRKSVGGWWWFFHHRNRYFAPVSPVDGGSRLFLSWTCCMYVVPLPFIDFLCVLALRRRRWSASRRWIFIRSYEDSWVFWKISRTWRILMNNVSGTNVPVLCRRRNIACLKFRWGPSHCFNNLKENPDSFPVFELCPIVGELLPVWNLNFRHKVSGKSLVGKLLLIWNLV
jgi:hypothetical protein